MRSSKVAKVMAVTVLVCGGLVLGAAPASAGAAVQDLDVEPDTSDRQVGRWDFQRAELNQFACPDAEYTVADEDGPVDESLYSVDALPVDGATGTLTADSALPAGLYQFSVNCGDQVFYNGVFVFGRVTVQKVVEGDAPAGAAFVVEVDCEGGDEFVEELEFGADGEIGEVYVYDGPTTCEVTETDDGGADASDVEGGTVDLEEPVDALVTVTNTFGEGPPDTTTTTTTTTSAPTTTAPPPAPAPPATAARPVVAVPTFVG